MIASVKEIINKYKKNPCAYLSLLPSLICRKAFFISPKMQYFFIRFVKRMSKIKVAMVASLQAVIQ